MPKLSGFNRKNIGARNYFARIESPPTTPDEYGNLDFTGTWTVVVKSWPCELIEAEGGEVIDGYQTAATTELLAIGDYTHPKSVGIDRRMRLVINGKAYQITAIRDVAGRRRDLRIELKAYADK